ncbi:MAG: hypothetical protein ACPGIH_11740 [Verrucomicrobiales bacterium]
MALLLKGTKGIFLHVPKTGGSWVNSVLEDNNLIEKRLGVHKHIDIVRLQYYNRLNFPNLHSSFKSKSAKVFRLVPEDHFIFFFVRHPLTWYESWWKYMSQESMNWKRYGDSMNPWAWHPVSDLNDVRKDDFHTFIESVIEIAPGFVSKLYSLYQHPSVSFVGKQETLTEDLISVLEQLELPFDRDRLINFGKVNRSVSKEAPQWDPDLKSEILRLEYPALKQYGYLEVKSQ